MVRNRFRPMCGRMLPLLLVVLMVVGSLLVAPAQALAASKKYKVKFNANGGTGAMSAQSIARKKSIKLKAVTFTRTGYAFTGWNTKKNGSGKAYANQAKVKNLAKAGKSIKLYAQWRAYKPYTVTFAANGGSGSMAKQSVAYGRAVALAANKFTRPDWAFTGWNTNANGSGKAYANKASVTNLAGESKAITLYAQWRPTTYLVSFDANGGSGTMVAQKITAGKLAKLSVCAYVREGHTFAGWNTAADGSGDAYDNKDVIIEDLAKAGGKVTLYAQWAEVPTAPEPETYSVEFDANGGEGSMGVITATVGKSFRLPLCSLSREGYDFAGWNTAVDGSGDAFRDREAILAGDLIPTDGSVTLYAQWAEVPTPPEPATYEVRFDANGGTGEMGAVTATVGKSFRLPACAFAREGYDFAGWNTAADGTGDPFADRAAVVEDLAEADGSVTLYAQWSEVPATPEPETYSVAFDANGGTGEMAAVTATVGRSFRLPACALAREGYEFASWNTAADGSGDPFADRAAVVEDLAEADGSVTLYAQWSEVPATPEPETYSVAFDANGGEGEMSAVTATVGRSFRLPACAIAREGYDFAGWNTAADGTGDAFADRAAIVEDLAESGATATLYAQWKHVTSGGDQGSFTIVFDNGVGGAMEPMTVAKDRAFRLPHPVRPEPDYDYDFWGWNTAADGSGTNYLPGVVLPEELSAADDETVTLYAQWEAQCGLVAFDLNGGSVAEAGSLEGDGWGDTWDPDVEVSYGGTRLLARRTYNGEVGFSVSTGHLVKDGCSFAGWELVEEEGVEDITLAEVDSSWYIPSWCISGVTNGTLVILRAKWVEGVNFTLSGDILYPTRMASIPRSEELGPRLQQLAGDASMIWTRDAEAKEHLNLSYEEGGETHYYTVDELFPDVTEATIYCWGRGLLIFDLDGGTSSDEQFNRLYHSFDGYITINVDYTASTLQKDGYVFAGWELDLSGGASGFTMDDQLLDDGVSRRLTVDALPGHGIAVIRAKWQEQ